MKSVIGNALTVTGGFQFSADLQGPSIAVSAIDALLALIITVDGWYIISLDYSFPRSLFCIF